MQLSSKNFSHRLQSTNRFYRVALYIAMSILVVQLIGMAFHKHDITEDSSDCVSCYLAAHLPSGVPPVSMDIAPTLTILYYRLASLPRYFFVAQQSYLVPLSQAPPRHSSPL